MKITFTVILFFVFFSFVPSTVLAIEENITIKVGFDTEYPPFSYVDERVNPAGFNIDIINKLADLENIKLEFYPMSANELPEALINGTVDLISGMKYSVSYNEIFDFTQSFFDMSTVLLVPKTDKQIYNLSDLKGKIVSVYSDSPEFELIQDIRGVKINVSTSHLKALNMFINGRSDAFIGDSWVVEYTLKQMDLQQNFVMRLNYLQPQEYAFAVRKGNFELLTTINNGLNRLKQTDEYSNIYNDWFDVYKTTLWRTLIWIPSIVALLAAVAIVLIYTINKSLKKEVARQTHNLSNHLAFQNQILNAVDNGIISFDNQGIIKLINYRSLEILGISINLTGTHLSKYPEMEEINKIVVSSNLKSDKEGNFTIITQSEEKLIHYYAAALRNDRGDEGGWLISLQDRTQQNNLQKKLVLQEKLRSLGQLVAGIAHELKNPLTSMKMFIELLPVKLDNARYREDLMKHVPEDFKRMNNLVDDLLDYTRRKEPSKEWVDLSEFVSLILKTIEHSSTGQIDFRIEIESGTKVFFDKQRMKQVFINLLMNAIDAVSNSSLKKITIKSHKDDSYIFIQIIDSGIGIKQADIPFLFQPFYTTKDQGVGIGLYICYNIMQEHEGDIDVHSISGEGTTFTLKIPGGEL